MSRKTCVLLSLICAGFLSLGNDGCPVYEMGGEAGPLFPAGFELDSVCSRIVFRKNGVVQDPRNIEFFFPEGVVFNGFDRIATTENALVGYYTLPCEPTVPLGVAPPTLKPAKIPIRLAKPEGILLGNAVYIDFSLNQNFESGFEPLIYYDSMQHSIRVNNPAGGLVAAEGDYSTNIFGEFLDFQSHLANYAFEIPVSATTPVSEEEVEFTATLLHLVNAEVLPHVPFGVLETAPAGIFPLTVLTTQIIVNNPHPTAVDGVIDFKSAATGNPLPVTIGAVTSSRHTFVLPPTSSQTFEIEALDPLAVAWAFVAGTQPLQSAANFVTFSLLPMPLGTELTGTIPRPSGTTLIAEAGISASRLSPSHVLNVTSTNDGISTAFAIVNPTSQMATIEVALKSTEFSLPTGRGGGGGAEEVHTLATAAFRLPPNSQTAQFFPQFFEMETGDFRGWIEIQADTSVGVTSLRTVNGLQSSSLPAGN